MFPSGRPGARAERGTLSGADRQRRLRAPPQEKTDAQPEPARGARAWPAASLHPRRRCRRHCQGGRRGTLGHSALPGPARPGAAAREVSAGAGPRLPARAAGTRNNGGGVETRPGPLALSGLGQQAGPGSPGLGALDPT